MIEDCAGGSDLISQVANVVVMRLNALLCGQAKGRRRAAKLRRRHNKAPRRQGPGRAKSDVNIPTADGCANSHVFRLLRWCISVIETAVYVFALFSLRCVVDVC